MPFATADDLRIVRIRSLRRVASQMQPCAPKSKVRTSQMLKALLLLPPSSKRIVELNQGDPFVELSLGKLKLRVEVAAVAIEYFKVTADSSSIPDVGQSRGVSRRICEQCFLFSELPILAVSDQRVRNLAEGLLD